MSEKWDYAEQSKAAKAAGGPEKYVEMIELASREAGRIEMLPWVGAAAVAASLATVAAPKIITYFKKQKKKERKDIEVAKQEIVNGINAYNTIHEEYTKGGDNNE